MTATALDIAIGIIIGFSMLVAYFRGLIREVFTLAGIVIAVFLSYKLGHMFVPEFESLLGVADAAEGEKPRLILGLLSPVLAAKVFSYGGTFIFVFVVMTLLGFFVARWVKDSGLGIVDKLLGAAFGFVRGFLLVFIVYVPLSYLVDTEKLPAWAKESVSVPLFQDTLTWVNKRFDIDQMVERGEKGVSIKLDKIDPDKIDIREKSAEDELKDAVRREEKEKHQSLTGDEKETP